MILNGECGVFNPVLVDCLLEVVNQQKTGKEGTPPEKFIHSPGWFGTKHSHLFGLGDVRKEPPV